MSHHKKPEEYEVSNKIFTLPNFLSFIKWLQPCCNISFCYCRIN